MGNVNRYDKPIQSEFINTYSPIPFDDMMKVGMLKRAEIDKGEQKAADLMGQLQAINVRSIDEEDYQARIGNMNKRLDETIAKYGNLGTVEARREVSKLIAEQQQDPWWRAAARNYQTEQAGYAAKAKALTEKGTKKSDLIGLERSLNAPKTSDLMKTNGHGMFNLGEAYAPTDVYEAISKRSEGMKASGWLKDRNTGQYIITEGQEGVYAEQVAATMGLVLKKTDKGTYSIDWTQSAVPADFMASAEGASLLRDAELYVENKISQEPELAENADELLEQTFNEMYAQTAESVISRRTHSSSTFKMDADPYYLAEYKKKLDDMDIPWTESVLAGTSASKINSITKLVASKTEFEAAIKDVDARKAEFIKNYDIDKANNTSTITKEEYTHQLNLFDAEREQAESKRNDLDNLEKRTKISIGVKPDYQPDAEVVAKAEADAKRKTENRRSALAGNYSVKDSILNEEDQKAYDEEYEKNLNEALMKADPTLAKYNKALKENAKAGTTTIGLTRFNSVSLNKEATEGFNRYALEGGANGNRLSGGTQGLQFIGDRTDFTDEDYENLSTEKDAEFLGWAYDHETENIKFAYRPYDKEGNLMKPVWRDAPQGAETYLINNGNISQAQVLLHRQMVAAETSPDKEGKTGLKPSDDGMSIIGDATSPYAGKFRKLYKSESAIRSGEPGYELVLKQKNPDTGLIEDVAITYRTRDEVINAYTNYVRDVYSTK